jgi:hypothetical protein
MRRGGVGTVSWSGAFGGWWRADPKEGSVLIFLAHNMVELAQMAEGIGLGVWGAIDTFQTLASASQSWPALPRSLNEKSATSTNVGSPVWVRTTFTAPRSMQAVPLS